MTMAATSRELLEATRNVWEVKCYRDGNRRRFQQICYIRAANIIRAEEAAKRESGCRVADAKPWNPARDISFGRFIRETATNAT
jgi:hypothetical protein